MGDDFGKIVPAGSEGLPFPLTIRVPDPLPDGSLFGADNIGQVLWATQPWMSMNAVLMGLVGLWMINRRRYAGQVTLVLLVLYSVARYTIESFRGDKIRGLWFDDTLSTSQLVSIVLGSLSLALLLAWRKRTHAARSCPCL